MYMREIQEAIRTGERALDTLHRAQEALDSAEGWGLFDLLGGGLFATVLKRSKMGDAKSLIDDLRRDLLAFQRELRDVDLASGVELEDDAFLSFADYVFDNAFTDFLVQRQINRAQEQLGTLEKQVTGILQALRAARNQQA